MALAEQAVPTDQWLWALGSLCVLHGQGFSPGLTEREFPPPHRLSSLMAAARAAGLRCEVLGLPIDAPCQLSDALGRLQLPLLVALKTDADAGPGPCLAIVSQRLSSDAASGREASFAVFVAPEPDPVTWTLEQLQGSLSGSAWQTRPRRERPRDPDALASLRPSFGFGWFVPELLKHRGVWRDVLLASLALQTASLATPLFAQAIIDKVVVHHTQSTLLAIAVALAVLTLFGAALTWVRQYLLLHTGNRVDAVLGAAVWKHVLGLPLRYFERRPTGVVAARLQGVETIREFIASAAIGLVLDLPFLALAVILMLWYSPLLSSVVLVLLGLIAAISAAVAPMFQYRLNEQFLLGARLQGFVTEHIAGIETVKCLQMEPQLRQRQADYLAAYLRSGFRARQLGNTYQVSANTLEQVMTHSILLLGAWVVMRDANFTIGMLVAFQMFSSRLSQPAMRLVGLWTQFQQARLAVQRLGDVMGMATEPMAVQPHRDGQGRGLIEVMGLAFRYADDQPMLYSGFDLTLQPGELVALMGPSGCGKSTLAKLLLGFLQPAEGQIKLDGVDIRHLAANELRSAFGVVPQDTTLFSGSILDNLRAARPGATMDQATQATRMAGLHDTIEALPQGYQTEIGERGVGLSGGQKQRLAIARALLKRPKVLIFDEATSALDLATAEAFATTVNRLKGQVSMVFIAHSLPLGLKVDRVINLGPASQGLDSGLPKQGGDR